MANYAELKQRAGVVPFARRLQLTDDFSSCPFHDGDGEKAFHVMAKDDGSVIGTCFSLCGGKDGFKTWDAISFVKDFDKVSFLGAVRRIDAEIIGGYGDVVLQRRKSQVPMTVEVWNTRGRPVTSQDVARLAASRPHSATPSAETLNVLGFKTTSSDFLVCAYRLGDKFYTVKGRRLTKKDFLQENAVSQRGLFNIDAVIAGCDVYIVESELDVAILHEHGFIAVSVISASQKFIELEVLEELKTARRIFLIGDNDAAGIQCMKAIADRLPPEKVYWVPLAGVKDVGECKSDFWKTFQVVAATAAEEQQR